MLGASVPLYRNRYRIPSARWKGWDYRRPGMYFVTICTAGRDCCLGEVAGGKVLASPYGEIVAREWQRIPGRHPGVTLDAWIVMPDHVHGVVVLAATPSNPGPALGTVVGQFKTKATKGIRALGYHRFGWQERFHDEVLGSLQDLERVRTYIRQNPERWEAQRNGKTPSP